MVKVFNVVANSAAILALTSVAVEAGKMGYNRGSKSSKNAVAVKDIKDYTGDSMLNKPSAKHNSMKESLRNQDFFTDLYGAGGAVAGFAKGAADGLKGNVPTIGFAILTLCSKGKVIKTASTVGMGISMAWDFLKNGTNLFTKKDLIEK